MGTELDEGWGDARRTWRMDYWSVPLRWRVAMRDAWADFDNCLSWDHSPVLVHVQCRLRTLVMMRSAGRGVWRQGVTTPSGPARCTLGACDHLPEQRGEFKKPGIKARTRIRRRQDVVRGMAHDVEADLNKEVKKGTRCDKWERVWQERDRGGGMSSVEIGSELDEGRSAERGRTSRSTRSGLRGSGAARVSSSTFVVGAARRLGARRRRPIGGRGSPPGGCAGEVRPWGCGAGAVGGWRRVAPR